MWGYRILGFFALLSVVTSNTYLNYCYFEGIQKQFLHIKTSFNILNE